MIQVRRLRTAEDLHAHLGALGVELPFDEQVGECEFAILPMEGWDAAADGTVTDLVRRRWSRFGASGAAMVWGGEAVAVREDGRANPNQLVIGAHVAELRELLGADQTVGLQLTHSGRFAHRESRPAAAHPVLDRRRTGPVWTDAELDDLVGDFVAAAGVAGAAGFDFVDVKACHGYLVHELLGSYGRSASRYGGESLDDRSRFLLEVVRAVRSAWPSLAVGVRLSVFDVVPHRPSEEDGRGVPDLDAGNGPATATGSEGGSGSASGGVVRTFGAPGDLREPIELVGRLVDEGVSLLCVTAGSPYYCPHVQRPAFFPPSDGYLPPEDPLVGVSRLVDAAAAVKRAHPTLTVVGSGYSYLQEWLPNVASAVAASGTANFVGLGRMALSYHDFPADVRAGRPLDRRRLCRTFSDCTTAPRNGLVSGCWPLDPFYKLRAERPALAAAKRASRWQVADA